MTHLTKVPNPGETVGYRAMNNKVYPAVVVELLGLDHHPLKAALTVFVPDLPEGSMATTADFDPDAIQPMHWFWPKQVGWNV